MKATEPPLPLPALENIQNAGVAPNRPGPAELEPALEPALEP